MSRDWASLLPWAKRSRIPPQLRAAVEARRAGRPSKKRVVTRAILMEDMANKVIKLLAGNKGKKLTRDEIAARIADNMYLAALAISEELADASRDEDGEPLIGLSDRMQAFKQLREWEVAQARIQKIDPKDRDKGAAPEGIAGYQKKLAEDKAASAEAQPRPERVTNEGARDRRHDNAGRPPGQGLAKQQEKIRRQQERLRKKETPEEQIDAVENEEAGADHGGGGAQSGVREEDGNPAISRG